MWGPIFKAVKADANPFGVGLKQFDDGDYDASAKSLQVALDRGLPPKDRVSALQASRLHPLREQPHRGLPRGIPQGARHRIRRSSCRRRRPAHPIWGPIFRSLKGKK